MRKAIARWKWAGISFVFFIVFLGRSGGGFGPTSMCGALNALFVWGTWLSLLLTVVLALTALLGNALAMVRWGLDRVSSAAPERMIHGLESGLGEPKESVEFGASSVQPAPRRRIPVTLGLFGLALGLLFIPINGCPPFRACVDAERPSVGQVTQEGLSFSGTLPDRRTQGPRDGDVAMYTEAFTASAPWTLTWTTTADDIRIDVFSEDAAQTGPYFGGESQGHLLARFGIATAGSEMIERSTEGRVLTGRFCLRVELRDLAHEQRLSSYYGQSPNQRQGTAPAGPRPMQWSLTVRSR